MAGEIAEAEERAQTAWVPSYLVGAERDVFLETLHQAGKNFRPTGEAVRLKSNGVQVLENERLATGQCRLRLSRFNKPPEIPPAVPQHAKIIRWIDPDLPLHYLYIFWKEL